MTLDELTARVVTFRDDREWKQFHTPKNLTLAIASEAGELADLFRWSEHANGGRVAEELADVLIFALSMADACGIDAERAVLAKLEKNAERYPVEACRGRSVKWSELVEG